MKYINENLVAILMATFNGEKYIVEQIDSIINQSFKSWTLYIRDDGSSDGTMAIIQDYADRYSSIIVIKDEVSTKGASENFFSLLCTVKSQYYMFSDQDDVWLSHKVEAAFLQIRKMENEYENTPIIVGSDLKVVDSHLNVISGSFWEYCRIEVSLLHDFHYLAVCNGLAGCSMMFNDKVKQDVIPYLPTRSMHDHLIVLVNAANNGIVEYMDIPSVLYRQHMSNVVGAQMLDHTHWFFKLKHLGLAYKQNVGQYKIARSIRRTSIFEYLWYKLLYTLKR